MSKGPCLYKKVWGTSGGDEDAVEVDSLSSALLSTVFLSFTLCLSRIKKFQLLLSLPIFFVFLSKAIFFFQAGTDSRELEVWSCVLAEEEDGFLFCGKKPQC